MALSDELERDLKWREDELAVLKAATIGTDRGQPHGRAMRRAYLAMLYAHYEGFSQFAWNAYLIELRRNACRIDEFRPELQTVFSGAFLTKIRGAPAQSMIEEVRNIVGHLQGTRKPEPSLPETANLWPNVFEKMSLHIGLSHAYIDIHRPDIKALVSRRNDVAHGKQVEVDDASLTRLENAVWGVIIGLALDVCDCLEKKTYLSAT